MHIKEAHPTDAGELTDLTIRSKNYWNYGDQQIREWKDELTITSEYISDNDIYKLTKNEQLVGFYAFGPEKKGVVKLNFLFIAPEFIGNGYGKVLMTDFLNRIKTSDYQKVTLDADPNAQKFYESMGFKVVGQLKSSIENRFLPIMEMELNPTKNKS